MVPADKAAKNIFVVCRVHYIPIFKQELNGTKAYEETSADEKSVDYSLSNEIPNTSPVDVKEHHDRLPTMYCYPSFIKDHIKLGSLQSLALAQLQNFQNY